MFFYRTRARNRTVPLWPTSSVPGSSHRTTADPASFAVVVKFAARSDSCDPGTYSSRPLRLSLTTTSDTGRFPVFLYRIVIVTTSPDCTGPDGDTSFVTVSGQVVFVSTSGSTTAA